MAKSLDPIWTLPADTLLDPRAAAKTLVTFYAELSASLPHELASELTVIATQHMQPLGVEVIL